MAAEPKLITAEQLHSLIRGLFIGAGVSQQHANIAADAFVWANLRGVDSHGVARVPRYIELFASGEAKATPDIQVERIRPGMLRVRADRAPGPVAMSLAMDEAVAAARTTGVAWVSVQETVHTGAIGHYVERAAAAGMAGICLVAGMPNMAYTGAKGAAVATSPIAIAVPSAKHGTVILDMATATIALGRIAQYKQKGMPLPEGAALTREGLPTTDASLAAIPTPMAGAKGAGLSLTIELLTSVLVGAPIVAAFHSKAEGANRHRQNAVLIAVDIAALGDLATFREAVDATLDALKTLPLADDAKEILFPGERGARTELTRRRDGIPLSPKIWQELQQLAGGAASA
jgi:ureidoglycolate dehydrogenase (NAD+)